MIPRDPLRPEAASSGRAWIPRDSDDPSCCAGAGPATLLSAGPACPFRIENGGMDDSATSPASLTPIPYAFRLPHA